MRVLLMASVFALGVLVQPVMAEDGNSAKKMELAKEYSKLVPVDSEVDKTIEELALQVPVSQRVLFKKILKNNIKSDRLRAASELALIEIFTEEELQAFVDFYKTEAGQAIKDKMPDYQARVQPILQQMVQDSLISLEQQM